jgi:hypothetical protein
MPSWWICFAIRSASASELPARNPLREILSLREFHHEGTYVVSGDDFVVSETSAGGERHGTGSESLIIWMAERNPARSM